MPGDLQEPVDRYNADLLDGEPLMTSDEMAEIVRIAT
jgi:hypothetical protein